MLMKRNLKAFIVLAIWLCWTSMAADDTATLGFKKLSFNTIGDSYANFIQSLRTALASNGDKRYGIPVLPDPSTVSEQNSYLYVQLTNFLGESTTLAVDVTTSRLVAYQGGQDESFFFQDVPPQANSQLFNGTQKKSLPFASTYTDLEEAADKLREDIDLGFSELDKAISNLTNSSKILTKDKARTLIAAIEMVLGAARFRYVEILVQRTIVPQDSFKPDEAMLSLEDKWVDLSNAIQQSNQGIFPNTVELRRGEDTFVEVDSLTGVIISNLALLKFICNDKASSTLSQSSPILIRSVIAKEDSSATCTVPEPTVRIVGRDGLCVDVRNGYYNDGNPIQLWKCKNNLDVNQLWTIKTDKTIRSNGKCLTTYGYAPGNYMMIYDCAKAAKEATYWEFTGNGTIINPKSSLALSANTSSPGTILTVEKNINATSQGWVANNDTDPFGAFIVGYNGLCLEANEEALWIAKCSENKAWQQLWVIYQDGTIRPILESGGVRCITSEGNKIGSRVISGLCSSGVSTEQRWAFQNDGSILNLHSGLVIDVRGSDPTRRELLLWEPTGLANQKWLPLLTSYQPV